MKPNLEMQRQIQLLRLDVQGMRYSDLPNLVKPKITTLPFAGNISSMAACAAPITFTISEI